MTRPRPIAAGPPAARSGAAEREAPFSQLLVAVIPPLRAFARGLCGRADLADDLAQEALTKAWAARHTYNPDTNFKAWIFVILRNHYFSWRRKQARVANWDPDMAEKLLVVKPAQPGNVELSDLAAGLQTLPDEQREALVLVGAGGFSYQEVAAIANCPVGTIKSRVARARRALEAYMTDRPASGAHPISGERATEAILSELDRLAPVR